MSGYSYSGTPYNPDNRINELVKRIQELINSNGNNQITGQILQSVLVDIAKNAGKWSETTTPGYVYGQKDIYRDEGNVSIGTKYISSYNRLYVNGRVYSTNGASDERLKSDVKPLKNVLSKILKLKGVQFKWRQDLMPNPDHETDIGMIAQEFEKEFPELIDHSNMDGYLGIEYGKFAAVLVEGIKELKKENNALKARVKKLEDKGK